MYIKFITPVLTLAALSFSASFLPVAHAAESLPGIFHQSHTSHISAFRASANVTKSLVNVQTTEVTAAVSASSDVKIEFDRSLVTSKPAQPKPKPVEKPADSATDSADVNYLANNHDESNDENEQTTAGLEPWQISQLNAQKNYIATQVKVPFTANPPAQAKGSEIVKIAGEHLGVPYVWGGVSSTNGWDCSGYVQWVFRQAGIQLPRVSQWVNETKIDPKDAQPGDLVVQNNGTHVGIYVGHGMMYSALNPSVGTLEHSTSIMKADYYRIA